MEMRQFEYPLTCCPLGDGKQDWNNLPLDQLESTAQCAVYGTKLYQQVSWFSSGSWSIAVFCFFQGCYSKLVDFLDSTKTWVIVVAVVILVIEVISCVMFVLTGLFVFLSL